MYPYPFPGPKIKNADCLRLAAFDDLYPSAQVNEGNGVSAVFELRTTLTFYTLRILLTDDNSYGIDGKGRSAIFSSSMRSAREKPSERVVKGRALSLRSSLADSLVDFFETEELASSQSRHYEALALVHCVLNHHFVSQFTGPDSDRNCAVVIAELPVLPANPRTILVPGHQRGRVVQINMLRDSPKKVSILV